MNKKIYFLISVAMSALPQDYFPQVSEIATRLQQRVLIGLTQIQNAYITDDFSGSGQTLGTQGDGNFAKSRYHNYNVNGVNYYCMEFELGSNWGNLEGTRFMVVPQISGTSYLGYDIYTDFDIQITPYFEFAPITPYEQSYISYHYKTRLPSFISTAYYANLDNGEQLNTNNSTSINIDFPTTT